MKLQENLDKEKRNRADADKARRKAEGELKIAQETLDELSKQKADIENALRRYSLFTELTYSNTRKHKKLQFS